MNSRALYLLCWSGGVPGGAGAALTALGTGGFGGFPAPGRAVSGPGCHHPALVGTIKVTPQVHSQQHWEGAQRALIKG